MIARYLYGYIQISEEEKRQLDVAGTLDDCSDVDVVVVVVENVVWQAFFAEGIKHWCGKGEDLRENHFELAKCKPCCVSQIKYLQATAFFEVSKCDLNLDFGYGS